MSLLSYASYCAFEKLDAFFYKKNNNNFVEVQLTDNAVLVLGAQ